MPLEMTADIARKQLCLVLSENLDNSKYTRMTAQVVYPKCVFLYPSRFSGMGIYIHTLA